MTAPLTAGGDPPGWAVRRVTPADVGQRVTLRRRVIGRSPGEAPEKFSDVVGTLEAWTGGQLTVRRRSGELVAVTDADVVASKVVPSTVLP